MIRLRRLLKGLFFAEMCNDELIYIEGKCATREELRLYADFCPCKLCSLSLCESIFLALSSYLLMTNEGCLKSKHRT